MNEWMSVAENIAKNWNIVLVLFKQQQLILLLLLLLLLHQTIKSSQLKSLSKISHLHTHSLIHWFTQALIQRSGYWIIIIIFIFTNRKKVPFKLRILIKEKKKKKNRKRPSGEEWML